MPCKFMCNRKSQVIMLPLQVTKMWSEVSNLRAKLRSYEPTNKQTNKRKKFNGNGSIQLSIKSSLRGLDGQHIKKAHPAVGHKLEEL